MPLPASRPYSWALLLLLVSSHLLWKNVASVPLISMRNDHNDTLFLKEMLNHALRLSQYISNYNLDLHRINVLDFIELQETLIKTITRGKNYTVKTPENLDEVQKMTMLEFPLDRQFLHKKLTSCHNYAIKTPENINEAQNIPLEDFPKVLLSRMWAWHDTLTNLLKILRSMPGTYDDVISLVEDIETENIKLLEVTTSILSLSLGIPEKVEYIYWSGLQDFQSSNELSQVVALWKLFYCLHVDMHTVDLYLKLLSCVVLVDSDVCLREMIQGAVSF
ncbi:prolactin-7A2-like [Acomys russatus]|uniref:prolactin-7A2-like n=1 Tax=Acomys russatus TaxID=60746 RepID=UPI0021E1C755|nr:prolactin-7A2-like [Acomys russatus]